MNSLVKFLVNSILSEETLGTVALFGGGFKPPTKGHLEVVLQGLKDNPEVQQVYILVGSGARNGVTQEEAIKIWKMYQKFIPVSSQIISVQSPFSFIKDYLQDHPEEKVYIFIGARSDNEEDEKDVAERSAFAKKYSENAMPVKISTTGGVSGTKARQAALSGNQEEFLTYFPDQLTDTEKQEIIDMISNVVKENLVLKENATYSNHIDLLPLLAKLTQNMVDRGYNIEPLPGLKLIDGDVENAKDFFGKTAYYDPNEKMIVLYTEGRHPKDIARSYAHEMIHHQQNLEGRLNNVSTTNTTEDSDLEDLEKEAYLNGNISFRNWTDSLQEKKNKDPFGLNAYALELARGLEESLNEGRYDSISRQLAKYTLNGWKDDFQSGEPVGRVEFSIGPGKDFEYGDLEFDYKGTAVFAGIQKYTHNGYAKGGINSLVTQPAEVGVTYSIPKSMLPQGWEEIYMDLTSTLRHEIEHLTQSGVNVKPGKEMPSDWEERKLIDKEGNRVKYVTLSKEIDANVQGLYLKAKKWRRPYAEVVDEYIRDFMEITNPKDVAYIKDLFNKRAKELNLPSILTEGAYDSIVSRLSKDVINAWKSQHDAKPTYPFAVLDTNYEMEDAKGRPLEFDLLAKIDFKKTKDRNYKVDGGANEGDDDVEGFISLNFQVDPRELPKMWSTIAMDIRDVLRHEIEHLTQGGWNVRDSKEMADDSQLRDLIEKYKLLAPKNYFMLDKEVDAMLQGMYFKAKKLRTPFKDVIDDYLNKVGLEPEEKEEIKTRWRGRLKALSLPLFEDTMPESTTDLFTIYLDMDGVIVDFDKKFKELTGMGPREFESNFGKQKFWDKITQAGVGFWRSMEWMPGGQALYNRVSQHNHFLLSAPSQDESSKIGKRMWRKDNTPSTRLILSAAKNKPNYADKSNILIDDRADTIDAWKAKGGIGILYKSADQVMRELDKMGL